MKLKKFNENWKDSLDDELGYRKTEKFKNERRLAFETAIEAVLDLDIPENIKLECILPIKESFETFGDKISAQLMRIINEMYKNL
jgi:hypothetical protein